MTTELPFDPAAIRTKIAELRRHLDGLTALMESYGLAVDNTETVVSVAPAVRRITRKGARRPTHTRRPRRGTKGASSRGRWGNTPKLADLGVDALTKRGGRAHGKDIVADLKAQGHLLNVGHPDSNLSTAFSRDPRVMRAADARNTWVLTRREKLKEEAS